MVASATQGLPSLTCFERLARTAELSVLRCRLMTGRMHQIRVHLAARGWPLVGDPTYGDPSWSSIVDAALADRLRAFPRQALHAWRLALPHPITDEPLSIEAPVPPDLRNLLIASGLSQARIRGPLLKETSP
jgi:23S rRNA pseudouridine1911/1915/1917 synthase